MDFDKMVIVVYKGKPSVMTFGGALEKYLNYYEKDGVMRKRFCIAKNYDGRYFAEALINKDRYVLKTYKTLKGADNFIKNILYETYTECKYSHGKKSNMHNDLSIDSKWEGSMASIYIKEASSDTKQIFRNFYNKKIKGTILDK